MLNTIIVYVDNNQTDNRHVYEDENLACAINGVVWICWYNLSFPVFTTISMISFHRVYCTNVTSLNLHLWAHWLIEWIEGHCYRIQSHQEKHNDNVFRQVVCLVFVNIKLDININHVVFMILLFGSKGASKLALSFDIYLIFRYFIVSCHYNVSWIIFWFNCLILGFLEKCIYSAEASF